MNYLLDISTKVQIADDMSKSLPSYLSNFFKKKKKSYKLCLKKLVLLGAY